VNHVRFVPPGSEPWHEVGDVWLYARLFLVSGSGSRNFSVRLLWLDPPEKVPRTIRTDAFPAVQVLAGDAASNLAWRLADVRLPGLGRYEFRARCEVLTRLGVRHRLMAKEYFRLEVGP
jgi:hypothetical protein